MIEEEYVPVPQAWIDSMQADARGEMDVADALYSSAVNSIAGGTADDIDKLEAVHRDAMAVLEGDNQTDINKSEASMASVENRLNIANQNDISTAYSAIASIGGQPLTTMPYIQASLDRGDGAQDAVDQIFAPRGQLVEDATPVDPFDSGPPDTVIPVGSFTIQPDGTCPIGFSKNLPYAATGNDQWWCFPDSTTPVIPPPPVPPVPVPPVNCPACNCPIPPYVPPSDPTCPAPVVNCPNPPDIYNVINVPPYTPVPPVPVPPVPEPPPPPPPEPIPDTPITPTPTIAFPGSSGKLPGSWSEISRCSNMVMLPGAPTDPHAASVQLAGTLAGLVWNLAPDLQKGTGIGVGFNNAISNVITSFAEGVQDVGQKLIESAMYVTGMDSIRDPEVAFASLPTLALSQWATRISGAPIDYLSTGRMYDLQWSSPQYLPSQAEIDDLYVTYRIDEGIWDCWTRAQGNIPEHRRQVLELRKTRPNPREEIELSLRGYQTPEELDIRLRKLGVSDAPDRARLIALTTYVPAPQDLVRFMVRDSFDPAVVEAFGYGVGFDAKFLNSEQARAIAKANGITPEVMFLYWAAHWNMPSFTQGAEMVQRLRVGRTPQGVKPVSLADFKQLLEVDDMAPAWVDRLIAVSYNVVTRTDLLTWFTNGSIEKAEVIERLQDAGYNAADSNTIAEQWELEVLNRKANRARTWTRARIVSDYIAGGITRGEAFGLLARTIPDPGEVNEILDDADNVRMVNAKMKCIASFKQRYFRGEFTSQEIRKELKNQRMDDAQVIDTEKAWTCELLGRDKQPTIMMLRRWFQRGVVSLDDIFSRLLKLRYTRGDAERIVQEFLLTESERREKQAKAAFKERLAMYDRNKRLSKEAKKEFEQELKDAQAELDKRAKEQKANQAAFDKAFAQMKKDAEKAQAAALENVVILPAEDAPPVPPVPPVQIPNVAPTAAPTVITSDRTDRGSDQPSEPTGAESRN